MNTIHIEKKGTFKKFLDSAYDLSVSGIESLCPSIDALSNEYLLKYGSVERAAKKFVACQTAKCATSGFISGLGGLITLPATVPANIASVLYVQMQMIACLAQMGGHDPKSDEVRSFAYVCLAGISVDLPLKNAGVQAGNKFAMAMVKKLPSEVVKKINQKAGFRLFTKTGSKGVVNLGKAVPVVGGVIGGSLDFAETRMIANQAYKFFIEGDASAIFHNICENIESVA